MFVVSLFAYLEATYGEMGTERVFLYILTTTCLMFGTIAVFKMVKAPVVKDRPSLFVLSFTYMMVALFLLLSSLILTAVNAVVPWVPTIPQGVIYALLFAALYAISVVSLLLFFGRPRYWLEQGVDAVPFRTFFRYVNRRVTQKRKG
jgi:hypothetical protein